MKMHMLTLSVLQSKKKMLLMPTKILILIVIMCIPMRIQRWSLLIRVKKLKCKRTNTMRQNLVTQTSTFDSSLLLPLKKNKKSMFF